MVIIVPIPPDERRRMKKATQTATYRRNQDVATARQKCSTIRISYLEGQIQPAQSANRMPSYVGNDVGDPQRITPLVYIQFTVSVRPFSK